MIIKSHEIPRIIKGHWAARNLAGFWGMMPYEVGGNIVHDLSGNGLDCIFAAGAASPSWSSGKYGSALSFDGGDYLSPPNTLPNHISASGPFTICIGFYLNQLPTVAGNEMTLFCLSDNSTSDFFIIRADDTSDQLQFNVRQQSDTTRVASATKDVTAGEWLFATAVSRGGADRSIFLNAANEGTNSDSAIPVGLDTNVIGAADLGALDDYLDGKIGFIIIYNRALTSSEIALLYQEPFCMFEHDPIELWAAATHLSVQDYTRGDVAVLPTDDADLETEFSTSDYDDVAVDDATRVAQTATGEFSAFLLKDKHTQQEQINVTWNGQSDRAPSDSTIYLQIYNRNTPAWENLDSESSVGANTDFDLTGVVSSDLSYYFDANFWIACRVYQEAI